MTRTQIELLQIAEALECTATAGSTCRGGECPYMLHETLEGEFRQKALKAGVDPDDWTSCDFDRVAMDAARVLREMVEG